MKSYRLNVLLFWLVMILLLSTALIQCADKKSDKIAERLFNSLDRLYNDYKINRIITDEKIEPVTYEDIDKDTKYIFEKIDESITAQSDNVLFRLYKGLLCERAADVSIDHYLIPDFLNLKPYQEKRIKSSIEQFEEIVKINIKESIAYHNLGWLYYLNGDKIRSVESIKKAIELNQGDPVFHLSIGMLYELQNDTNNVYNAYSKAVSLSSEIVFSTFFDDLQKRDSLMAEHLLTGVIQYLCENDSTNNPILLGRLGALYFKAGNINKAKEYLKKSISLLPNLPNSYYYLGLVYTIEKEEKKAKEMFMIAHHISRREYMPAYCLAGLALNENDDTLAIYYYRIALERYRNAYVDANKSIVNNYLHNLPCDCYIPSGLLRYSKFQMDFDTISNNLYKSYKELRETELSEFFKLYIPVYATNVFDIIDNEHFKSMVIKANVLMNQTNN